MGLRWHRLQRALGFQAMFTLKLIAECYVSSQFATENMYLANAGSAVSWKGSAWAPQAASELPHSPGQIQKLGSKLKDSI